MIKKTARTNIVFILILLFFKMSIAEIQADTITVRDNSQSASLQAGIDGAPLISLAYQSPALASTLQLDASLSIPTGELFNAPWYATYAVMTKYRIAEKGNWKIYNRGGLRMYTIKSFMWSGVSINAEERIEGGYYAAAWHVALELGARPIISTYVKHSDASLRNNPELKNGWYGKGIEGLYLMGLSTSYSFGPVDVGLRFLYTLPLEKSRNPLQRSVSDSVVAIGAAYNFEVKSPRAEEANK